MARQREGKENVTQTSDPQHPSWQRHGPKVGAEVTTHFNYATLNSKLLTLEMQESAKKKPLGSITFSTLQLWPR